MRSPASLHCLCIAGLALIGSGLLAGCASSAPKDRSPLEVQAEKLKSSQNACIRLRQAVEDATKNGLEDAADYRPAMERACRQYEIDKREMDRLQLEHPASRSKRQF